MARFTLFGRKRRKPSARPGPGRYRNIPRMESSPRAQPPPPPKPKRKKKGRGDRLKQLLRQAARTLLQKTFKAGLILAGAGLLWLAWLVFTLPDLDKINTVLKTPSIVVRSEAGDILGTYGDVYGDWLRYDDFPTSLVDAVLATEDRNFFRHPGLDPLGIARAMFVNLRAGKVVQGGSTVTQQVAKNLLLTPERSMTRKLKEALLALRLEQRFTKQQIMTFYLNRVYLGAGNYGMDAAARRYFGKTAQELELPESAILAGLLKAPSRFAPTSNPELARKRAELVLHNMVDAGFLAAPDAERAKTALPQALALSTKVARSNLYFTDWVVDQLPEFIPETLEDLEVLTTLDSAMQRQAEAAVTKIMDAEAAKAEAGQAALLAIADDGAVRAMVGGRSYAESQFNRAAQSKRQPGSAFKLFVYLAALEHGFTPDTMVEDRPVHIGKWQPKNYKGGYMGPVTLREAFAESINTVAVQLSEEVGRGEVIHMAKRLGVTSELIPNPSIALGAAEVSLLELTGAYAHVAAWGRMVTPYGILEIKTTEGDVLYKREAPGGGAVLRQGVVAMMNELLLAVTGQGTGAGARFGRAAAGKTGTTSDYKDAWFIGFSPPLVAGVWVGNDEGAPMKKVTGGSLPARIWREFMAAAMAKLPAQDISTQATDDGLPWQGGGRSGPSLGPSFWQKLMGEESQEKVEYDYPEGPRR